MARGALVCVGAASLAACDPPDGRDLAVSTVDPPASVIVGASEVAETTVSNLGSTAATGVTIQALVPLGVDVELSSPAITECSTPEYDATVDALGVACQLGDLAPGAAVVVDVTLTGMVAGAAGSVAISAASTGGGEPQGGGASHVVSFPLSVVPAAGVDLHVEAPGFEHELQYGETVDSVTQIANRGTLPAAAVTVTQEIPAGFTVGTPTLLRVGGGLAGTCGVSGPTATCTTGAHAIEPLAGPGDRWEMRVPLTPTSGSYFQIIHTASSPSPEPTPDPSPNSATVDAWRDLAYLAVGGPSTVAAGTSFEVPVTWVGWGFGQYVSGYIPPNLRLDGIRGGETIGLTCSGTGAISCSAFGPFIGDGAGIILELTALEPGGPGSLSLFINSEAGSASGSTSIEVIDASITSDVHPDFTAPTFALLGEPATVAGEVRTAGSTPHDDVTAVLELPVGAIAESASWGSGRIPCPITGRTVTCALGDMSGYDQVPVELVLISHLLGPAEVVVTTASATAQDDPDPWPDTIAVGFPVRLPFVDVGLTAAHAPEPPTEGRPDRTTYTVTNHGSEPATGVALTVAVPDGYAPYRATRLAPVAPGGTGCAIAGQTVTCGIGPLAGGASQVVEVLATTGPPGAATYLASVTATEPDPVPDEQPNTATIEVDALVPNADLRVSAPSTPQPVILGETRSVTATVRNFGPSPVTGAFATVVVPEGWQLVSATSTSAPCTVDGTTATCGPRALTGTGTQSWNVSVSVTPLEVRSGDQLSFAATSELADLDPSSNTASATLTSLPYEVDLGVSTSLSTFGDWASYVVNVTNLGPATATGVTVTGTYPEEATVLDVSVDVLGSDNYPCTWTDHEFTCPLPDRSPGGSWSVRLEMAFDPVPGPLTFELSVSSDQPEANPEALPNTVQVELVSANQPLGLSGTVVGAGGSPVAGASVFVYAPTDGVFPSAVATTAADGTWSLPGLGLGEYKVRVSGSGITTEWYHDQPTRALATVLTLTAAAPHQTVDVDVGN